MLYYTNKAATLAVVVLMTIALCSTTMRDARTQFVKNKLLATSYATEQAISQLNCVRWCFRDGNKGKCKIAGYSLSENVCSLSMDSPEDLMDVADEMSGVFVIEPVDRGCIIYFYIVNKEMLAKLCTLCSRIL